ncbi:unnamed protein product [Clavelina lepadiformis]|uniref:Uncharacterized protein n=1 Tax=Clavelina lepadiformis TaxID=159417 RepID=A0ABP0FMU1_CLALP
MSSATDVGIGRVKALKEQIGWSLFLTKFLFASIVGLNCLRSFASSFNVFTVASHTNLPSASPIVGASGGNDNKLLVWSASASSAFQQQAAQTYSEHLAAVNAIAWSPHQHGLLASGGGTADRCIRFWNTLTQQPLQCVDTGSQVCNLAWSKHASELVSTHGYSQNQILLWKYPSLCQVAKLTGHSYRVLYLVNGEAIVTGAGDETLRFWNVFSKSPSNKESTSVLNLFTRIR